MSNTNYKANLTKAKNALTKARDLAERIHRLHPAVPQQVRADMLSELVVLDARADALYASLSA